MELNLRKFENLLYFKLQGIRLLVTCILISSCRFPNYPQSSLLLNSVTFSGSSYINVLYSYINLTILDFFHSVEIAFFLFSLFFLFFFLCVHLCFSFLADL